MMTGSKCHEYYIYNKNAQKVNDIEWTVFEGVCR